MIEASDETAARRAERGPNRDLPAMRQRPHHHQPCDVGARDEEDQPDRGKHPEHLRADLAHLIGAKRRQFDALLGGLWKLAADRLRDAPKLGGRRLR